MAHQKNHDFHAIVDMGSNGIRFSISNLSQPTTRILPTLFQDRAGISLYDAQFEPGSSSRMPIPEDVQTQVISRLLRFKVTCEDFGVPAENIKILATEATRSALNASEFTAALKKATGWDILMLSKEEEGRIGALGVASSLSNLEGLMMDLGGGSVQLTWLTSMNGIMDSRPEGSISFPYGAAALTRRLGEAQRKGTGAVQDLEQEMIRNFHGAVDKLNIPNELAQRAARVGGYNLYLSGGGFRGWGYLLMSKSKVNPYPIPYINGFKATKSQFHDTLSISNIMANSKAKVYGVSARRASQVPAIAFLINALVCSIPSIKNIHFCQGGVREGFFFDKLPLEIQFHDPLVVATAPHRLPAANRLTALLQKVFPLNSTPPMFTIDFLSAVVNSMYIHSVASKESRAAAALHSTTTGFLASAHGLSHANRAMLALVLHDRWSGDLSPPDESLLHRLRLVVPLQDAWWCQYIGRVAAVIGEMYPAGIIRGPERMDFSASFIKRDSSRKKLLELLVHIPDSHDDSFDPDSLAAAVSRINKTGKKGHFLRLAERDGALEPEYDWKLKVDAKLNLNSPK